MKFLTTLLSLVSTAMAANVQTWDLQCEYHAKPIALGTTQPRFSWKIRPADPAARDVAQAAYEIIVTSTDGKALWNSGKTDSARTSQIEYAGSPLASRDRATWKVRIWDGSGEASDWSSPADFGIGLLTPEDWQALWISAPTDESFTTKENIQNFVGDPKRGVLTVTPAKYLRKEFTAPAIKR